MWQWRPTRWVILGLQGDSNGKYGRLTGHAVRIEPGLYLQSPEIGSFSSVTRRLSAVPLPECRKSEFGDEWLFRKSPPLAGLSATISGHLAQPPHCLAGVRGFELAHSRSNPVSACPSLNLGIWAGWTTQTAVLLQQRILRCTVCHPAVALRRSRSLGRFRRLGAIPESHASIPRQCPPKGSTYTGGKISPQSNRVAAGIFPVIGNIAEERT
jgi:hypothetical protein